jgi:SUF system NifU family Fe-S assembly protein
MNPYQDLIMDHYRFPRNKGVIKNPDVEVDKHNASCGDQIKLQIKFDKSGKIQKVAYICRCCAVSTAISSLLTETVKGKTANEVKNLKIKDIEKLIGQKISIGRVKCATLCLEAFKSAIKKYQNK